MQGRTTIIISHSPAPLRTATSILVLESGRIVERGAYAELRAHSQAFARLFKAHPVLEPAAEPVPR